MALFTGKYLVPNENKSSFHSLLFCILLGLDKFLMLMKAKTVSLSFRLTEILHYLCTGKSFSEK